MYRRTEVLGQNKSLFYVFVSAITKDNETETALAFGYRLRA